MRDQPLAVLGCVARGWSAVDDDLPDDVALTEGGQAVVKVVELQPLGDHARQVQAAGTLLRARGAPAGLGAIPAVLLPTVNTGLQLVIDFGGDVNLVWAATGAAAGLMTGTALRGVVFRLSVPAGAPDRATCPGCAAHLDPWPASRCAHCGHTLGIPGVYELATAAVLALLFGRFGGQPVTLALGFLGALGVALAAIDIRVQRLPDRLTLPAYPLVIALLAVAALTGHDLAALVRALLGGLVMAAGYLLLGVARPGQLGGGDIKVAGLAGLVLGWLGWPTLLAGAALGFVLAAVASLALLAARRVTMHSAISFGPFLLGGALLAILADGQAGSHFP